MLLQILILSILTAFTLSNSDNETTLLLHINSQMKSLELITDADNLVSNSIINSDFKDMGIYKIERWCKFADENDVYNGISFNKVYRVYIEKNTTSTNDIKMNLEKLHYIDHVEFEYKRKPFYTPNDPRYNNQWFLEEINANDAWDIWDINQNEIPGDRSIILSSVDLGVNWQHQDLVENLWQNLGEDADGDGHTIEFINNQWVLDPGDLNGIDDDNWDNNMSTFIDDLVGWDVSGSSYGDNDPDVPNNGGWAHGTHVAGLLAASTNNNTGIASTCFNCSVMSVKCTNENDDPSYISNGFDGVLYAAKAGYYAQGFSIVNCSWGGVGYNMFEDELMSMCTNQYNALIFAAAGNENVDQAHYPSSYQDVVSVTALGQNNSWNHWATYHETVDLASPGESIHSCVNNGNGYSSWSGTSMASPVAASVAGLMKSKNPEWMVEQIKSMILSTANPIIYTTNPETYLIDKLGSGRVDALNAITTPLFPNIDLAEIDIFINDGTNQAINAGETVEFSVILFNNLDWGEATNPEINFYCDSEDIEIINGSIQLDNILGGDAGINFEPIIMTFSASISADTYNCNLDFLSNHDSYIYYSKSFDLEFEVEEMEILLGDINQDETVDVLDVIMCVAIILENITPNEYENMASDMNLDGDINVQDVIYLVNLILS